MLRRALLDLLLLESELLQALQHGGPLAVELAEPFERTASRSEVESSAARPAGVLPPGSSAGSGGGGRRTRRASSSAIWALSRRRVAASSSGGGPATNVPRPCSLRTSPSDSSRA